MAPQHHLPPLNARIELRLDEADDWHRSLVQDVVGDDVVVSAPTDERGLNVVARVGDAVHLFWHSQHGPLELPAELVEARRGVLALWTLHPTDTPERASRRAFFRVPMSAPVAFGEPHEALQATLVDLSEGGLRCHVRAGAAFRVGDQLAVTIQFDDSSVAAAAEVARVHGHDLGQELGLRFLDLPPSDSDAIRQHLFAEQRRLRAKGLA